jgi:hypothetical protein
MRRKKRGKEKYNGEEENEEGKGYWKGKDVVHLNNNG